MPLISFDASLKHQKTSGFLMFSGVSKEISGMKWVNTFAENRVYMIRTLVALKLWNYCKTDENPQILSQALNMILSKIIYGQKGLGI